jgi:hypothetical protein
MLLGFLLLFYTVLISLLASLRKIFLSEASLFFLFKHTFSGFEFDLDRCPLESKCISNTVFDIANIGEMKMISVVYRYNKSWWIDIDL